MVPLTSLWLPILLSAVFVFLASFVVHMVLPHHRSDYRRVPAEDDVMAALRKFDLPPGDYMLPRAASPSDMKSPDFMDKMTKGPILIFTVIPSGPPSMAQQLVQWFVYCVVVGSFAAYVAGRALGPGADYVAVFRFAGTAAFLSYAVALWQQSIWYRRAWSTTVKSTIDSLAYALLTGGTFGWLWP
jgi:hypothetical protein